MAHQHKNFALRIEDGVAIITLNRPERLNILNENALLEFEKLLTEIAANQKVKVVLLRSSCKKAFTAGADINEMCKMSPQAARRFAELGQRIGDLLETALPPVIACLNGYVLGGGIELACACDIRIASEDAIFAQSEVDLGIFPGWGGTQRLVRLIGPGKAKELIYTGKRIDAREAFEIGLVNQVVPPEKLDSTSLGFAKFLAKKSRVVLMTAKKAINLCHEASQSVGLEYETDMWANLFSTKDQKEGMTAFLERRKPKFVDM